MFIKRTVRRPYCISENYFLLFIVHTYPLHPSSSAFFINVFLLSVYINYSLNFSLLFINLLLSFFINLLFFYRHPFPIDTFLVIEFNKTIGALFVLLPFNVYVSPTPSICCAWQNIKLSPLFITSFLYAYFSMFTNLYLLFPLMFMLLLSLPFICIFRNFSDHAVVIFPQLDRIHVRF
jgi:hypothetical protein